MKSEFPARLHVLLASHAPVGVVIRRGPSKQVATLLWDRRRDSFELGQWLKGRIFERRCDLSPDGRHLIYFAMNGKWMTPARGAWTAISRAPYVKALALFPKGDCWHGGGLWTNKRTYWLNDGHGHSVLQQTKKVSRDMGFAPCGEFGGECPSVYYPRLLRDGWELVEPIDGKNPRRSRQVFEKALVHGWRLRKVAHSQINSPAGKGCYWDEHLLVHPESQTEVAHPDWEWADLDDRRLVWASEGKLFAANIEKEGVTNELELFDFNPMKFEAIEAPY